VAAFGAFVDVGVHQDGLVHVSAMSSGFVSDPRQVAKSGEVVRVKVMSVDTARKRISLSMRLDDEPGDGQGRGGRPAGAGKQAGEGDTGGTGERPGKRGRREDSGGGAMADALRRAGLTGGGKPGSRQ
jgi:uncharacterized protein